MTDKDYQATQLQQLVDFKWRQAQVFKLSRLVGYSLLLFTVLDLLDILTPLQLFDPSWELQAIGTLVERIPVPLIAFVLIFQGEQYLRKPKEKKVLNFLSWSTLLISIVLLLMLPLGIVNTVRMEQLSDTVLNTQINQQHGKIQAVKDQLNTASTAQDLQFILKRLGPQDLSQLEDPQKLSSVKQKLVSYIENNENLINVKAAKIKSKKRRNLFKRSIKWNVILLLSSGLFFCLWRGTSWARIGGHN